MIEANLWWAAWIIKEVSSYSTYSFMAFLLCSFLPVPPAELLSACHELRCRYGCVMARNGTFCFCADGFEVGEDGTSCRGRILHRWWGLLPWSAPPFSSLLSVQVSPFALGHTSFSWISRSCCLYENHLGLMHSTDTHTSLHMYTNTSCFFYVLHGVGHRTWFCYSCTELFEFCT